jgi:hypothetical protein
MIFTFLLVILIVIIFLLFFHIKDSLDFSMCTFIISLMFVGLALLPCIYNVNNANKIKAQIILMKPLEKYKQDVAMTEFELSKVERLIEKAFDKNNPNVSVKMENGIKIYSFLGSSDLGSAEAGNAKKQELLVKYIEKQNELADKLIYVKKMAYGDEYYKLQQDYAVYANSIFSGWIVRLFSINEGYKPVQNKNYAPNE